MGDIKQPRIKSPSKYRVERLLLCARSENRRLRAALREIEEKSSCAYSLDYDDVMEVRDIARKALKEVPRG